MQNNWVSCDSMEHAEDLLRLDPTSQTHVENSVRLRRLAKEYESRCEQYDETVCGMKSPKGHSIPANGEELALVCRNARKILSEIAIREKMDIKELHKVISETNN